MSLQRVKLFTLVVQASNLTLHLVACQTVCTLAADAKNPRAKLPTAGTALYPACPLMSLQLIKISHSLVPSLCDLPICPCLAPPLMMFRQCDKPKVTPNTLSMILRLAAGKYPNPACPLMCIV